MINEVINEIVEAEARGEQIIAAAQASVAEIGVNTHTECDAVRAEYTRRIKENNDKTLAAARKTAEDMAAQAAVQAAAQAAQIIKNAEKNVQRTVEWLADAVMKDVR